MTLNLRAFRAGASPGNPLFPARIPATRAGLKFLKQIFLFQLY